MKYLVTWYDGNDERATLVEDSGAKFPYGVEPEMIDDRCEQINVIVAVPDNFDEDTCVVLDRDVPIERVEA
jgi:hypothetical protein